MTGGPLSRYRDSSDQEAKSDTIMVGQVSAAPAEPINTLAMPIQRASHRDPTRATSRRHSPPIAYGLPSSSGSEKVVPLR